MIHISREPEVPKAFKSDQIKNDIKKYQQFYTRSVQSRSQEGFNEVVNGDTTDTLVAVAKQFKYKCATCEMKLTIQNVICDSWRPRQNAQGFENEFAQDHYWWVSYVWNNKYCLCPNCNKFKGTWFPVEGRRAPLKTPYAKLIRTEKALLIDPCHDYPEEHLLVDENGKLLCLTKKGETTIEVLKLNRRELLSARKAVISNVSDMLQTIEKIWNVAKDKTNTLSHQKSDLRKLYGSYTILTRWLKNHPEEDFVMVKRQVTLTWLYLKPHYHHTEGLKNLFPKLGQSSLFKDIENIFRFFQQLLKPSKRATTRTFRPQAILNPKPPLLSKDVPAKAIKKIVNTQKKTTKGTAGKKAPAQTPVTTLPILITQGLNAISHLATDPLSMGILSGAASIIKDIFIDRKKVRLYPEKIEIKNFKSIGKLTFDFKVPASDTKILGMSMTAHKEPWKFLLGENGVGKSSILQAISLVLAGDAYIQSLQLDPSDLLKHGTRSGMVKIWFSGVVEPATLTIMPNKMTCNFETGRVNVLGYGSTRIMPKANTSLQPEESSSKVKIKNLFDYSVSLSDVKKWLLTIDQRAFDQVARAVKDVLDLPSVNTYFIRESDQIYFSENKVTLDQLSEGYRSVISLAVDIMKSLSEDRHNSNAKKTGTLLTYDAMEGIVLVDEISSHLHPRWQMKIVKAFRKAFPKLQFIVTSHDPLSLKGIEHGEVLLLKRDEQQQVIGIGNLPDPTELKAEQLLTSEFFGLSSTLDPELEIMFNTYHYLLAKSKLTPDESKQLDELKIGLKEKKHLGDSLREELMYNVIDTSLAKYASNIEVIDRKKLFDDTKTEVLDLWDKLYKK